MKIGWPLGAQLPKQLKGLRCNLAEKCSSVAIDTTNIEQHIPNPLAVQSLERLESGG